MVYNQVSYKGNNYGQYYTNSASQANNGYFTGDNGTPVTDVATQAVGDVQTSPLKTLACIVSGFGIAKGIDKIVDGLTGRGNDSPLGRAMNWIDDRSDNVVLNKVASGFKKVSDKFGKFRDKHSNFNYGYTQKTMLAQTSIRDQFVEDIKTDVLGELDKRAAIVKERTEKENASLSINQLVENKEYGFFKKTGCRIKTLFGDKPMKDKWEIIQNPSTYLKKELRENLKANEGISSEALECASESLSAKFKAPGKAMNSFEVSNLEGIKKAINETVLDPGLKANLLKTDGIEVLKKKLSLLMKRSNGKERFVLSRALAKSTFGMSTILGGGSSLGLLMNGTMIGMSVKSASEAKKGEKVSTFMQDMFGNYIGNWAGMLLLAPFWNGIAHMLEGAGNKIKNVADLAKGELPEYEKLTNHNFGHFILNKIGSFMNLGQGTKWNKEGGIGSSLAKKAAGLDGSNFVSRHVKGFGESLHVGNGVYKGLDAKILYKGLPGGVMRLIVVGYFADLIFGKPLMALSHKIFGKPTDPKELEKEKELRKQQQQASAQAQQPQANPYAIPPAYTYPQQNDFNKLQLIPPAYAYPQQNDFNKLQLIPPAYAYPQQVSPQPSSSQTNIPQYQTYNAQNLNNQAALESRYIPSSDPNPALVHNNPSAISAY